MNMHPLSLVRGAGHSITAHPDAARLVGFRVRRVHHAVYDLTARRFTAWPMQWHRLRIPATLSLREAVAFFQQHCGLDLSASDHSQRRAEAGHCQ